MTPLSIDTHQHFWRYRAADYPWIDQAKNVLQRDFLPADLEPLLARAGVGASLAVQAQTSIRETEWLLELADVHPFIVGVVGWVDLTSNSAHDDLDRLAAHPTLVGIRHIVHDEPDDRFLHRADFRRGIGLLEAFDLTYDLLIFPKHLPSAIELVEAFPAQRFVLDHLAKPDIRNGVTEPWGVDLKRLARNPRVCAKISGLITEADWHRWSAAEIARYVRVAYDCFGPDRLMLGSDWPVCTLAGDYGVTMGTALEFVAQLPASEQAAICRGNVTRWYPRVAPQLKNRPVA